MEIWPILILFSFLSARDTSSVKSIVYGLRGIPLKYLAFFYIQT
jgi:hypothetical protein